MKQDFLSKVLPTAQPAVSADQLPDGQSMRAAEIQAGDIQESVDMIELDPKERAQIGPASTPHELEVNRLYAELTNEVPELLELVGEQAGAMSQGYEMEKSLWFYRQANTNLINVSRGAVIICGAALTEENDKVEEAAKRLAKGTQLSPERRVVIGNAAQSLDRVRATQKDAQAQQQRRKEIRQTQQQQKIQQIEQRTDNTRRLSELSTAPLPQLNTQTK